MRKIFLLIAASVLFIPLVNAQNINEGNFYFGTRVTGLDFSFSDKTSINLSADAGYFIMDKWAIGGRVGVSHYDSETSFCIMANASYYFLEADPGVFFGRFGLGVDRFSKLTSFVMDISAGYSLFLNEKIAIEPSAGFFIPFKDGRDASFNLGIGFSLYF